MIVVCGPSKSGKTTGVAGFVARHGMWRHVIASSLLSANNRPVSNLNAAEARRNQLRLNKLIVDMENQRNIVLDGHLLVPLKTGFYLVEPQTFSGITISDVVFINPLEQIACIEDTTTSSLAISIECSYSKWMAHCLQARYHEVCGDDLPTEISITLETIQFSIENKFSRV